MTKFNAPISVILALLMIVTPLSVFVGTTSASETANVPFAGGSGTIVDPYIVENAEELQNMSLELDAHYILNNSIDASNTSVAGHWLNHGGAGFEPVGDHTTQFTGTFDGQGYTISNLYINRPGGNPVGMFGRPGAGSYIGNVSLTNANITGGANTAILVGYNEGTVDNCSVYGIIDGSDNTGGVIGTNAAGSMAINCFSDIIIDAHSGGGIVGENRATVMDCLSYGSVSGVNNVGGLVGLNSGPIYDSFSYVDVFSSEKVAGGLVGSNGAPNGIIENCSAYGDVHVDTPSWESDSYAGGLVGSNSRPINNSSAHGNVYGNKSSIGGLVGKNWASGTIATSYATGSVNDLGGEVAHWTMDEAAWTGAADEVLDSSGNGNHGTAVNGPTTVPGKFGMAGNFSSAGLHRVDVPDDPSLNITKNITVSVWVNTAYVGFLQTIVGKDDDGPGGRSWHLCIQNGNVRFNVWTTTTGQTQLVGTIPVNTGTWRHIVATYDGSSMDIYVDGTLDISTPKTGDIAAIVEPVQIGCMNNNWYFDGLIDDVRIYDRALSPNEIYSFNCDNVGGLVGDNEGNIDNCYSSGSVTGNNGVGGLVGINSGTVTDSAWDNETSGLTTSAGGTGLNTTLMMMNTTFITAGWDFTNTWWMVDNETRPFLRMEYNTTIRNSHQVQLMQLDLAADYTLANDIDMDCANPANMWGTSPDNGNGFSPIGNDTDTFLGTFDGKNFTIDGLYIGGSGQWVGLFGFTNTTSVIHNIHLSNANISGNNQVGILAGRSNGYVHNSSTRGVVYGLFSPSAVGGFVGANNDGGLIENCTSNTNVYAWKGASQNIGGFVGTASNAAVTQYCSSAGYVEGETNVGGFVGILQRVGSTIFRCWSTTEVGGYHYLGGFVGTNKNGGTIKQSYSTGNVSGYDVCGGFVGQNVAVTDNAVILDCYSEGASDSGFVDVNTNAGAKIRRCYSIGLTEASCGFCWSSSGTIAKCYYDNETSGASGSGGGQGRYTSEMMQQATFTDWDFATIWGIYEHNTYPFLQALGPTYVPSADLNLTIESSPYPIAQNGSFVHIYVNVTNHGPDNAVNVNVTVTGSGADMELNNANQTVVPWDSGASWYPSLLGPGETAWLLINLTANESGMFFLNGTCTSDVADPVLANNDDGIGLSINDAPIAANDPNMIIDEDPGPINMDVLLNDNDPDGDDLTVISVTQGVHGTVVIIDAGKNVTYEPDLNWNGDDWFNYTISDGRGGTDTATVNISVLPINDATVAVNDAFTVAEDSGANTLDVLANDYDLENDTITVTVIGSYPLNGTVEITPGGLSISYTPNANFNGVDSFTYRTTGNSNYATVNLTITPVNDAPVITTTFVLTTAEDSLYYVDYNATDVDGDTLVWGLGTDADWLSIDADTGILSGTPTNNDLGYFSVNVTVDDGSGGTDWQSFYLLVMNTNDAPVISTTTAPNGTAGEPYSSQVNATDDDGDSLTWSLDSNATWLSINTTGWLTGTPDAAGTFWVNVSVNDGNGGTDSVNLTITIASTQAHNDTDGDGVPDDQDAFPDDPAASLDADNDDLPDEWNDGYTADDSTTGLKLDDDPLVPNGETGGSNSWLYIIIILVIVGIVGAVLVLKGKGPKPEAAEPVEDVPEDIPAPEEAATEAETAVEELPQE